MSEEQAAYTIGQPTAHQVARMVAAMQLQRDGLVIERDGLRDVVATQDALLLRLRTILGRAQAPGADADGRAWDAVLHALGALDRYLASQTPEADHGQ